MRFGIVFIVLVLLLIPAVSMQAHLADEFPQVTLQIKIDDEAVDLVVRIPAKVAKLDVFDGMSPVAMDRMEPVDLSALVGRVLAERCPVQIDGVMVPPVVMGAVVDMPNSRQPARRFPESQVLKQGILKFFARYETKGEPDRVSLDWSIFANEYDAEDQPIYAGDGLQVVGVVNASGKEQIVLLTPEQPVYTWQSEGAGDVPDALRLAPPRSGGEWRVPVPSIVIVLVGVVCGGITLSRSKPRAVGLMAFTLVAAYVCLPYGNRVIEHRPSLALNDDEAIAVFESLHRNIYRAFDYTDEGAVYDALAQSVDGPMLETIYNDVYQSLIMREEEDALSKVVRVEMGHSEIVSEAWIGPERRRVAAEEPGAFVVDAQWQVDGLVTHYGHSHARTNAFEAVYVVAPRPDGWRIVESQIIDQRRIDDGQQTAEDLLTTP